MVGQMVVLLLFPPPVQQIVEVVVVEVEMDNMQVPLVVLDGV
jgi:hypothetical protein